MNHPLSPDTRLYIAGHRGLVGSALWRHFRSRGFTELIGRSSDELDLRDSTATARFFAETRPEVVVCAAALVGGIVANDSKPVDFLSDNLRIQLNLIDSAVSNGVRRLLFLGSSCVYPRDAEQPIVEEALLSGPLEATNQAYAVAKIAGITQITGIRRQLSLPYISAMPTNVFGPGDNFDPAAGHVVPAMIQRFHRALVAGDRSVTCWGSGRPRREFLYADDLADACHFLLDNYDDRVAINVGTGAEVSIEELARIVARIVGYTGEIRWDTSKPDGTPRKRLDTRRLDSLGWHARTSLESGLRNTYEWFLANTDEARVGGATRAGLPAEGDAPTFKGRHG
ncbi:GDP-L-fucose synthase [Gordonia sp. CPCC 205515]|uniref:GDP-L-fucose synthase family protein n=1 Tax=Gordonia sp. CPCC 205515 TaxID=3140791 RepID=UPI003AF3689B